MELENMWYILSGKLYNCEIYSQRITNYMHQNDRTVTNLVKKYKMLKSITLFTMSRKHPFIPSRPTSLCSLSATRYKKLSSLCCWLLSFSLVDLCFFCQLTCWHVHACTVHCCYLLVLLAPVIHSNLTKLYVFKPALISSSVWWSYNVFLATYHKNVIVAISVSFSCCFIKLNFSLFK